MLCDNVLRTDHIYTYSYLDRFKYYDLIRHKVYATTTKQSGVVMELWEMVMGFGLGLIIIWYYT